MKLTEKTIDLLTKTLQDEIDRLRTLKKNVPELKFYKSKLNDAEEALKELLTYKEYHKQ